MVQSVENKIARRYSRAFIELGVEEKSLDRLVKDMHQLDNMLAASIDLQVFIATPLYRRDEREAAVKAIAEKAKFHPHTIHFLEILAQHRRLKLLPVMVSVMDEMVREVKGIQDIHVNTATQLNKIQEKRLSDGLKKAIGKDVALQQTLEPELLGGMVIHMGSVMIDDSLKTKMERLTHTMKGTA